MKTIIDVAEKIQNPSALTQEQGDLIYEEIANSFDKGNVVTLDFTNVESMISPFLNNAIGQLYGRFNSEYIKQHLELKSFPPAKNSTLNIVINNAKNFYANRNSFSKTAKDVLNID